MIKTLIVNETKKKKIKKICRKKSLYKKIRKITKKISKTSAK